MVFANAAGVLIQKAAARLKASMLFVVFDVNIMGAFLPVFEGGVLKKLTHIIVYALWIAFESVLKN